MHLHRSNELSWLLRRVRPVAELYVYTLACLGVTGVLALLDPLIIKWLIDDVIPRRDLSMIPVAAFGFFLSSSSVSR